MDGEDTAVYFGGTDEKPFLAQLNWEALRIFEEDGEEAFFDFLIPEEIKKAAREFNAPILRQGDFFAVKYPYSWETAMWHSLFFTEESLLLQEVKNHNVFNTRHLFTGKFLQAACGLWEREDYFIDIRRATMKLPRAFVEGVLEAPDHVPLDLTGGVHVLVQVTHLHDPVAAD